MAYRRYRRRRKQSSPSMASTLTKPFRALPNAMGLKSPILQTLVATPLMLAFLYRFMPDTYDTITAFPETIADWVDEKIGG